jgi:hypothetical protein
MIFHVICVTSLTSIKRIKPKRTNAGNRNPLKTMSLRTDIVAEYVEIKDDRIKDAKRFTVAAGKTFVFSFSVVLLAVTYNKRYVHC